MSVRCYCVFGRSYCLLKLLVAAMMKTVFYGIRGVIYMFLIELIKRPRLLSAVSSDWLGKGLIPSHMVLLGYIRDSIFFNVN